MSHPELCFFNAAMSSCSDVWHTSYEDSEKADHPVMICSGCRTSSSVPRTTQPSRQNKECMKCCKTMSPQEHSRQQTLLMALDELLARSMQLLPFPLADSLRLAVHAVS